MASTDLQNDDCETKTNHLELFSIIWVDALENDEEIRTTEKKLRKTINHLKRFSNVKQCQQYIEQTSQNNRLILVVSGRYGRELVPVIYQLRQITSIYVYCMDRDSNLKWSRSYAKVKDVVVTLDDLVSRIREDYQIERTIGEPLSINYFRARVGTDKSMTGANGRFVFFQVLLDCLLRLKSTQADKNELISLWESEYEGNRTQLANIREFQENYSSKNALGWYLQQSFFYKTLNAALCTKNIHMMFLFRSYISDIHRQLEKCLSKTRLKCYRSQIVSEVELKQLQQYVGQDISINSFFSATRNNEKALSFLQAPSASPDLKRVIFEIDADSEMAGSKPFADLSKRSEFAGEFEILFMMGSIFRLDNINSDEDEISIIQMTFCGDGKDALKQILCHMKQQFAGSGEITLETFGRILCKMRKFDLAEKYYNRLLDEITLDDPLRCVVYEDLAELASMREDFDTMVEWRQKLLEAKKECSLTATAAGFSKADRLNSNMKWKQNAVTIAGGCGDGDELNQLSSPCGIFIDDGDQCIYISEWTNNRIVKWAYDASNGKIIDGKNGQGSRFAQLNKPTDVILNKNNDYFFICDYGNNRVVRLSRQNANDRQTIIPAVHCFGLALNNDGDLYVSDWKNNEVRRWKMGETDGTLVAGGTGQGNRLDQLNCPTYIFVDDDESIYVSDCDNNRVMKWTKGAKEGIIVAGGQGEGNGLNQLSDPQGLAVDHFGNVYVADSSNHRIVRWSRGSKEGTIVVGGNGQGQKPNQFNCLRGLSFDRQGNLYVADCENNRVQRFDIDLN